MEPQKPKTTAKDFFMYLGSMVFLYWSAGSLLAILFALINKAFPDKLSGIGYYLGMSGAISTGIRIAIASMIVTFPLYLVILHFIRKDIKANAEKALVGIRKWLIYLTLFFTGLAMAGDLIGLIYQLLNGEITTRFILKVLSILVVAGLIFAYYIIEVNNKTGEKKPIYKTLEWVAIILVVASIIGGFFVAGSPVKQRNLRFDNQRISDLRTIQSQIETFWNNTAMLPQAMTDLKDDLSYYGPLPKDPETGKDYEYQYKTKTSFALCADFALSSEDLTKNGATEPIMYGDIWLTNSDDWKHQAGHQCIERTINPNFHRPYNLPADSQSNPTMQAPVPVK